MVTFTCRRPNSPSKSSDPIGSILMAKTKPPTNYVRDLGEQGFAVIPECLDAADVQRLLLEIESAACEPNNAAIRQRETVYAIRNLSKVAPGIFDGKLPSQLRGLVEPLLGSDACLVRAILFDKTADTNWGVFWHQDLSIAVRQRDQVVGFDRWSVKSGVTHVQPPASILERMLTVRLHLDACHQENGALQVLPKSHRHGRLTTAQIDRFKESQPPVTCCISAGGAVVMRPLILHRSEKATQSAHRRVLHMEFSAELLPEPLEWYERIAIPSED